MCKYCEEGEVISSSGDLHHVAVQVDEDDKTVLVDFYTNDWDNLQQWFYVNYCPMCGRRLNGI